MSSCEEVGTEQKKKTTKQRSLLRQSAANMFVLEENQILRSDEPKNLAYADPGYKLAHLRLERINVFFFRASGIKHFFHSKLLGHHHHVPT